MLVSKVSNDMLLRDYWGATYDITTGKNQERRARTWKVARSSRQLGKRIVSTTLDAILRREVQGGLDHGHVSRDSLVDGGIVVEASQPLG